MEANGNVVVTQKDQIATGDRGDFDMRNNTVTLTGNVVVTRAEDVLRGNGWWSIWPRGLAHGRIRWGGWRA